MDPKAAPKNADDGICDVFDSIIPVKLSSCAPAFVLCVHAVLFPSRARILFWLATILKDHRPDLLTAYGYCLLHKSVDSSKSP